MNWRFWKKKKEKPFDFKNYDLKMSIKTLCYYERLANKSFFKFSMDDIGKLIYASFVMTNKVAISYEAFEFLLENEKIALWFAEKSKNMLSSMEQISSKPKKVDEEKKQKKEDEEERELGITDLATSLVVDYGVDVNYVMNEMELWEIQSFYEAADTNVKRRMEEERFWTYMTILPHIDSKKCKSPSDFVPFEWEKETRKTRVNNDLKNNMYAMKHLIGSNIFGEKDEEKKDG